MNEQPDTRYPRIAPTQQAFPTGYSVGIPPPPPQLPRKQKTWLLLALLIILGFGLLGGTALLFYHLGSTASLPQHTPQTRVTATPTSSPLITAQDVVTSLDRAGYPVYSSQFGPLNIDSWIAGTDSYSTHFIPINAPVAQTDATWQTALPPNCGSCEDTYMGLWVYATAAQAQAAYKATVNALNIPISSCVSSCGGGGASGVYDRAWVSDQCLLIGGGFFDYWQTAYALQHACP